MFGREHVLFLFVVVISALVSVKSCSTHPKCAEGDDAIELHGKCVCKRDIGYCSNITDCGYERCGSTYEKYCHTEKHKCGCIKAPESSTQCTTDSNCSSIHCTHSYYMKICHNRKCHCLKEVSAPRCIHEHHHHHHDEVHCPASSCHSPYSAICLNDHCTCISDPPPCKADEECGNLNCNSHQLPQCVKEKCTCVEKPTAAPECTNDSVCVNTTCSGEDHPTCHGGKCVCKRGEGYCTTSSHCGYIHCERDWHHHCHSTNHECGCIHAPHGSDRCSRDSSCSGLHCSHSKAICSSGKCHCMKTINTHTCHSRRRDHHHEHTQPGCPNNFCDSPYNTTCIHGHCVCLNNPPSNVCHSDSDCKDTDCTSNHIAQCVHRNCTCVGVTTSTLTTTDPRSTKKITTLMSTTKAPTTKAHSTTTGAKPEIPCPVCDASLNCTWNRTCPPETQTCMIRSYAGYNFTVHCSMTDDCHFIQSTLHSGEIFCCNDRKCLSTYLGI